MSGSGLGKRKQFERSSSQSKKLQRGSSLIFDNVDGDIWNDIVADPSLQLGALYAVGPSLNSQNSFDGTDFTTELQVIIIHNMIHLLC